MRKFRNVFLGGYQKNEVDSYVEALMEELEQVRGQAAELRAKETVQQNDSEEVLQLRTENEQLKKRMEEMQKETDEELESSKVQVKKMQDQLSTYENSRTVLYNILDDVKKDSDRIMTSAKLDADKMTSEAQREAETLLNHAKLDADKITIQAQAEADDYRRKTEQELEKKREDDGKQYMLAKYKLMEYINALNKSQSTLIQAYNELGELVKKMPIRLEDVFSDEPMELLGKRPEKVEEKPTAEIKDETAE